MGNEATSQFILEHAEQTPAYETANTIQSIASAMQFITTTQIEQVALVTITLHFESEVRDGRTLTNPHAIERSTLHFLEALRRLVRKTDVVYMLGSTFYFILRGANSEGGNIVQTRLWDALLWRVHNTHERDILRPRIMSVGHAAYPKPFEDAHECIIAANEVRQSFDTSPDKTTRKAGHRHTKIATQDTSVQKQPSQQPSQEGELTTLARKLGIPYLSLLPRKRPEQIQQLVTLKLAHELQCYPLGRERGTLTVALSNPQDGAVLERLRHETGLHIFPVLTHPQELQTALNQLV